MSKPIIAIPIGDPAGIGPEIVAKSLEAESTYNVADCIVVGDKTIMENAIAITKTNLKIKTIEGVEDADFTRGVLNLIDLHNIEMSSLRYIRIIWSFP